MNTGKFYQAQIEKQKYTDDIKNCIEKTCELCLDALSESNKKSTDIKPIMMLGKIQSGKTRAYTGVIALSFDNGFDLVLILTKNSSALVNQTYRRMRREFINEINDDEVDVYDIMTLFDGNITEYELDKKLIVVAKKQKDNLDKISDFIEKYQISPKKFCLIIDDEADTTGIGFSKNKDNDDEFDLRTVASKVNSIRGSLKGYVFLQVTATPYALYLQPDFNDKKVECIRPYKTVLVPSGKDYIGGEYYFLDSKNEDSPARFIFEEVSPEELEIVTLKNGDRRKFKEEDILINDKLRMFKKGICNFIIGGCILRFNEPKSKFSYIIHTNIQKASHIRLENIAEILIQQIKERNSKTTDEIEKLVWDSYTDIKRSLETFGNMVPDYQDVRKAFYNAIDRELISITVVNSDKDIMSILNEDTGELKLRTPFSIFVGGQVLDRGVTIPRNIGFYYGRNPKVMQQDTVMQHSRMFGYRDSGLLSITRFYTTRRIYENLTKVTEIEASLREDIENNKFDPGIYFIQSDLEGRITPCSPEKIRMSNIIMFKSGARLLPVGFSPIAKTYSKRIAEQINKLILSIQENDKATLVRTEDIEKIIHHCYEILTPDKDSARFIDENEFISVLRYLSTNDKLAYLIVRRGRKLSKYKNNGTLYSDAPDTPHGDELQIAKEVAINNPAIMLIHEDGTGKGWNGSEFWWPVLITQKNAPKTIFALENPEGKISKLTR
jgi:hypothetical protein